MHIRLDILGSIGVLEGVVRLVETIVTSCNIRDHDGSAITAQTVFEKSCQFRISVRDVIILVFRVILVESVDAVTERQQRSIDISAFDHPLATIIRFRCPFGTGQINERKLAHIDLRPNT